MILMPFAFRSQLSVFELMEGSFLLSSIQTWCLGSDFDAFWRYLYFTTSCVSYIIPSLTGLVVWSHALNVWQAYIELAGIIHRQPVLSIRAWSAVAHRITEPEGVQNLSVIFFKAFTNRGASWICSVIMFLMYGCFIIYHSALPVWYFQMN